MDDPPEKSARFQLVMPHQLLAEIRQMATEEHRSVSNMIVVLVLEAVKARRAKQADKPGDSLPALLAGLTPSNSTGIRL